MSNDPETLTAVLLRRIDEKIDRLISDVYDLKVRTTGIEENLAGVHRRIDRLGLRFERIEKRLEFVDINP
jgi:hypothetical protein